MSFLASRCCGDPNMGMHQILAARRTQVNRVRKGCCLKIESGLFFADLKMKSGLGGRAVI